MAHQFDELIAAVKQGEQARLAWLMLMRFADADVRVWPGVGQIVAGGQTWLGSNGTIQIKNFSIEHGFIATKLEITLSGIDAAFQARAEASKAQVQNRRISVYLQGFDSDWQPLGEPLPVWTGLMDRMAHLGSIDSASITLSCETPFATRNRPRAAYYTDADQRERASDDVSLEFISTLEDKSVDQPVLPG